MEASRYGKGKTWEPEEVGSGGTGAEVVGKGRNG